jgi:hypothetical protein
MDKKTFWNIIKQSKLNKDSIDMNLQSDAIMDVLHTYEKEDLFEFQILLNQYQHELNTAHLEAVASTILDVSLLSEHVNEGFIKRVICLGEDTYNKAKEDPMSLFHISDKKLKVSGRAYLPELSQVPSAVFYDTDDDADWGVEFSRYKNLKRLREISKQGRDRPNDVER